MVLIISADSGSALLDGSYRPVKVLVTVAIISEPPYRRPSSGLYKIIEREPQDMTIIKEELECIMKLLDKTRRSVDVAHIDISAGAIDLSELRIEDIDTLDMPRHVRTYLRNLLPQISPLLKRLKEEYGISPIGIGKESVVVRLAELGVATYGVLYGLERIKRLKHIRIGLPKAVTIQITDRSIRAKSLLPGEHDLEYEIKIDPSLLKNVELSEYPNPIARGFRVVEIRTQ